METQTQSESLDVDVLLNDESKLNSLLEHLKNHPDEIAKTVSHLLHKSREKDRGRFVLFDRLNLNMHLVLYEREEEVEEGQDYLTRTLEICLSIIAQTKNAEEYFKVKIICRFNGNITHKGTFGQWSNKNKRMWYYMARW